MFTLQQIQEISRKLSAMCKKDSDFQPLGERETLDKKDFIAFVKDNKNRSMTLGQLYSFIIKNICIIIYLVLELNLENIRLVIFYYMKLLAWQVKWV